MSSSSELGKPGVSHGERSRSESKRVVLEAIEDAIEDGDTDLAGNVLVPEIADRVDYGNKYVRELTRELALEDGKLERRDGVVLSTHGSPNAYTFPDPAGGST